MIAGSILLFVYWFRYTCLLILSTKTARDYAGEVAAANDLSFLEVQELLRDSGPVELDQLNASLERDFALLSNLQQQSEVEGIEDGMLKMNYTVYRFLFKTVGRFSPDMARKALDEMSGVISHFANALGERAAAGAGA
jgi:hypothetical protein